MREEKRGSRIYILLWLIVIVGSLLVVCVSEDVGGQEYEVFLKMRGDSVIWDSVNLEAWFIAGQGLDTLYWHLDSAGQVVRRLDRWDCEIVRDSCPDSTIEMGYWTSARYEIDCWGKSVEVEQEKCPECPEGTVLIKGLATLLSTPPRGVYKCVTVKRWVDTIWTAKKIRFEGKPKLWDSIWIRDMDTIVGIL